MVRQVTQARLALIAIGATALVAGAAAQQIFRTGTDVVLLSITAADGAGRLLPGLDRADFQVYEDGVLQDISNFSRDPQPIALSLVLDTSTSMELKISVVQEAASGFVRRLSPRDAAQIIDFDSQAKILQTFTGDHDALERAVRHTQAGGSTSLYNAIYTAISELKRSRATTAEEVRRQAIVLLSDGEDTSSIVPYEDVLDLAKRSEVILYAIGLRERDSPASRGWNEAEFVLRSMAQETGGRVYFVSDIKQLSGLYEQIADELANQYTIGYTSKNPKRDGAWRRIVVKVAREGATARTKSGYFGPTGPR